MDDLKNISLRALRGKKEPGFDFLCTRKMGFTALGLVFKVYMTRNFFLTFLVLQYV